MEDCPVFITCNAEPLHPLFLKNAVVLVFLHFFTALHSPKHEYVLVLRLRFTITRQQVELG